MMRVVAILSLHACAAASHAAGPIVQIVRLDGRVLRGELMTVVPELIVRNETETFSGAWADILELRIDAPPATQPASQPFTDDLWWIELADNGLLRSRITGASERTLQFTSMLGSHSASLAQLARLSRSPASLDSSPPAAAEDVCVIRRGETSAELRGRVLEFSAEGVRFERSGRALLIPWQRLVDLRTATAAAARTDALRLHLRDGSRLVARILGGDERRLQLASRSLGDLELDWSNVLRVEVRSQRVLFLSDLRPSDYQFQPFLAKRWTYALDRDLRGRPLTVGGATYPRGVALHSQSRISFEIGGIFEQFAALAGIADAEAPRGNVTLRVLGDDRELWSAGDLRGGAMPLPILVDVRGVQTLTLVVEFGADLDLADHAVFAMARLLR